ncbi:hypothetical protein F4678DRAFT_456602 [Xylaria arbuscula]|nr:hypothetical protein F4678DRAFT_456602 [Xylaria arbuscula]
MNYHLLFPWILKTIFSVISNGNSTPSLAESRSPAKSGLLGKRDAGPNTTTSVVAGILVTAFVILAGIFCYVYRRSIRFREARKRRRHHHHRRRPSGISKMSQGSDAVPGGSGDGGADAAAPAPDAAPAEA